MKWAELVLSALTAFVVSGGGALVVVAGSGFTRNATSWVLAAVLGAISAAQDVRSSLKLPPVIGPAFGPERKAP